MNETFKILVVDDDEIDRMTVRRALKAAGIQMDLQEADCSEMALTILQEQAFDCMFLDYLLPDGDGLELLRTIRALEIKVALVVLTGQGDEQIAVELMKAGALDYLSKSRVSPESLARSLRNAIRLNRAEIEAAQATQRLRESEERYRLVLEGANDGIWDWDIVRNRVYCNDRLFEIMGRSRDSFGTTIEDFANLCHPDERTQVQTALLAHLSQQVDYQVEMRLLHGSGEYRHCIVRGKAQRNNQGIAFRMSGTLTDTTERKRAAEAQQFLLEAGILLSTSLDYQTTLETLAQLVIPYLADWCTIHIIQDDQTLDQVAGSHQDFVKMDIVKTLHQRYPLDLDAPCGVPRIVRTGQPEFYPTVPLEVLAAMSQNAAHLQLLQELGTRSMMGLPLIARGRTLGAIVFMASGERSLYTEADFAVAQDLAYRAALAVDNARLYQQAREIGENFRQALLILGEQQGQLRTLQQLTNLLNQRLANLPELLQLMIDAICGVLPDVQFGLIALHQPQQNSLVVTAQAGRDSHRLEATTLDYIKNHILNQVFATGKSQLVQLHPQEGPQEVDLPAAVYGVTIESAQAGRLGVLAVGNWQRSDALDGEEELLLKAFGEQAAIAINNARLISTLEEREERLALQNNLLLGQNLELEQQRQQIEAQNVKLIEAAQMKSQFLATMSHELRTPMNAIIGFSQLLMRQQRHLTSQQADMVARILNNGKNLLTLINDILDLSKLEAGRLELKLEAFDVVQLVRTTADELRSLAEQKKLTLEVHSELSSSQVINDSVRLRQVLVNLISNAIKFTETGQVRVTLTELENHQLAIEVQDTGIGISEADLPHIFEEFHQVDQALTKKYAGTGLGLAITDWLMRMMSGQIKVQSQLGKGSTFTIHFPRRLDLVMPERTSSSSQPTQPSPQSYQLSMDGFSV